MLLQIPRMYGPIAYQARSLPFGLVANMCGRYTGQNIIQWNLLIGIHAYMYNSPICMGVWPERTWFL